MAGWQGRISAFSYLLPPGDLRQGVILALQAPKADREASHWALPAVPSPGPFPPFDAAPPPFLPLFYLCLLHLGRDSFCSPRLILPLSYSLDSLLFPEPFHLVFTVSSSLLPFLPI